jgi:haloalkane dehalogenase
MAVASSVDRTGALGWPKLYPFTGQYISLAWGVRLHYLDEGQGETVVMLHGNPTWSFYYRDLIRELHTSYRCIVPDHIGCGLSDKPYDRDYQYTLRQRVDDLDALLEHLGLTENLTLVLHDWGGMIGMAYAHLHPQRIARLVILNTAAFRLPTTKRLPWSLRVSRSWIAGALLVRGFNAFCRGAARFCSQRPLGPAVRAGYLAPYDTWHNRIAVLRFVQDIPLAAGDRAYELVAEVEAGLRRFAETPGLICWGLRDFVFDRHFLNEWQRRFPAAEVHAFPNAGHYVLEDAGDEIRPLVTDFLHRHPLS